jgi:hypothetical protein
MWKDCPYMIMTADMRTIPLEKTHPPNPHHSPLSQKHLNWEAHPMNLLLVLTTMGSPLPDHEQWTRRFFAAAGQLLIIFQWHSVLALQEALSTKFSTSGAVSKSLGLARSVMLLVQLLTVFGCPTPMNLAGNVNIFDIFKS